MEANLRKLSRRRSGSPDSDDEKDAKRRKGPSVLEAELASYTRGRKSKGKGKLNDDDDVMAALGLFTKKMSSAPKEKATKFEGDSADAPREEEEQSGEGLDVDDDLGWMGHKLVEVRTGKDAEVSRRAEADYEVGPVLPPFTFSLLDLILIKPGIFSFSTPGHRHSHDQGPRTSRARQRGRRRPPRSSWTKGRPTRRPTGKPSSIAPWIRCGAGQGGARRGFGRRR